MTYDIWMQRVDNELTRLCCMSLETLPDWLSRDAYDEGMTPLEGALTCLESAGYDLNDLVDEP